LNNKFVYLFAEGNAAMKDLLGGKGANLAEMSRIGLPVPPGFTITTEACKIYSATGAFAPGLEEQLWAGLKAIEDQTGKKFGDPENPLLVSVRSGAAISMPGMMDTILNLGLNDDTVEGLARAASDRRFALDCYRRFIQMFGNVVLGIDHDQFEFLLEEQKKLRGAEFDYQLPASDMEKLIESYQKLVRDKTGRDFPQDPPEQLLMAVKAVFESWNNPRAKVYRRINKIDDALGTAVNIQTMVFGNLGEDCGTGVAFTRNPSTGEKVFFGEFLLNAQGEDVVAGIRTPKDIAQLKQDLPEVYQQLSEVASLLEKHYHDMQDIEFTVERRKLYMLQTRNGKRTSPAAVRIAVDMVGEGLITKETALKRVDPASLDQLLHRRIDPQSRPPVLAKGLPASPGAATGEVVFNADDAERLGREGRQVILVRTETTPDDIHGIVEAQGVVTSRGGMTSHAAVVARGMGKPCVSGCEAVKIDSAAALFRVGTTEVRSGDLITIDGGSGEIFLGRAAMVEPELSREMETLLAWADELRTMEVRANADTPEDAQKARELGAKGIGLTRTEHMFMQQDRLPVVQQMILAESLEEREAALAKLLPVQQGDFYGILKAMAGYPVTIRLLDPPLHEFLPKEEELVAEVTELKVTGRDSSELARKVELLRQVRNLKEFNPMLGHRGCRLGISYPEIYAMQARAIFQAAAELTSEGVKVYPEVEIPLVIDPRELQILRDLVIKVADEVKGKYGVEFDYTVGTMIELPRACLLAGQIAEQADFFSFGTNDLTQTTLGFSRDDAEGKFLPAYLNQKIFKENPFAVLDTAGVGRLMQMAVEEGRRTKPDLQVGICGEHGGDPESIAFCQEIGLNFVSCSPFRVPIARLAAAQAVVIAKDQSKGKATDSGQK